MKNLKNVQLDLYCNTCRITDVSHVVDVAIECASDAYTSIESNPKVSRSALDNCISILQVLYLSLKDVYSENERISDLLWDISKDDETTA